MTWRFRPSFVPAPSVRISISPNGISTSTYDLPTESERRTAAPDLAVRPLSLPGSPAVTRTPTPQRKTAPSARKSSQPTVPAVVEEIRSAGSSTMTTSGLSEFKRLLENAQRENSEIAKSLRACRAEETEVVNRYQRWKNGWLFRRLFKAAFAEMGSKADITTARRVELEQQEILSRLKTQIQMPHAVELAFARMIDDFALVAFSERIWDTVSHRSTNRVAERTAASRAIDRRPVSFKLGSCQVIDYEEKIPHLENANGGDIFLYPAFILYFLTNETFALLEYKEVQLTFETANFVEEAKVPSDSEVVAKVWAKANKDGSRDKRFAQNYEIPVAKYGRLVFASKSGMREEYLISNFKTAESFASCFHELAKVSGHGN